MKMADFLALETLEPHNKLLEEGKVVPMDLDGAHKGVDIQFVSHQWLGYEVADPKREHLQTPPLPLPPGAVLAKALRVAASERRILPGA